MTTTEDGAMLEETRAVNAELERLLAISPTMLTHPPAELRTIRREGGAAFPPPMVFLEQAQEATIPGRGGAIKLRVFRPEREATGVYLHIHGGGWTLGAADEQDMRLWELAQATGLVAASVEYRLGPEHPYPAGPDDCEDAAVWLVQCGAEELGGPRRLAIGGESAGAHLSVVTLLRLRDRHRMTDVFAAANLVFGAYDLGLTPSQRLWGTRNLVLSTPIIERFYECFLPALEGDARRDPDISPLYARLHDLPPALFTVGTMDPLLDDSLFMEARWRAAGGQTELRVWPEAPHGFVSLPTRAARAANDAQHAFLRAAISPDP
jgi:acetyl esterase/lipase